MNSRCFNWLIAFLCTASMVWIYSPAQAAQPASQPSDSLRQKRASNGQKTFEVAQIVIHANADRIFKILTDYQNAGSLFPGLKSCRVVQDLGATKYVAYKVEPNSSLGTYQYQLEITETRNRSIEWHRIKGDLRAIDGSWKLEPDASGANTIVTYSSSVQVGFFMPQSLVNRQIRNSMPGVLYALKSKAEGPAVIADNQLTIRGN